MLIEVRLLQVQAGSGLSTTFQAAQNLETIVSQMHGYHLGLQSHQRLTIAGTPGTQDLRTMVAQVA